MSDYAYLARNASPLSSEQWAQLDDVVTNVARSSLVGCRFIPVFGPIGAGVQSIADGVFTGLNVGAVDDLGEEEYQLSGPNNAT